MTSEKSTKAVVVPCGPRHHDPRTGLTLCARPERCLEDVCLSRINPGIALAREFGCPIVIVGDGHDGEDVRLFEGLAWQASILEVFTFIHHGTGTTLTDMEGVAELMLKHPALQEVREIHLATDVGHMRRAKLMLKGELSSLMPCRTFHVFPRFVRDGFVFPKALLRRERKGVRDYIRGRYDRSRRPTILSRAAVVIRALERRVADRRPSKDQLEITFERPISTPT